jgi:hypothetical protein
MNRTWRATTAALEVKLKDAEDMLEKLRKENKRLKQESRVEYQLFKR